MSNYIIFNLNSLGPAVANNISFLDGKIKINETNILKTTFIFIIAISILLNQGNLKNNGSKTEKYIILLTNL